jgi:phage terminase small subunit
MKTPTKLQAAFAQHYISNGFNACDAALKAGYSSDVAKSKTFDIVHSEPVQELIIRAIHKADKGVILSHEERLSYLKDILTDIMPRNGEEPKRSLYKVAIAAIAEINKMHGDYAPQKLLRLNVDITKEKLDEAKRIYEEY